MGLGFGDSRAAAWCQEQPAIAMPGKRNEQAAPAAPLQLASMPGGSTARARRETVLAVIDEANNETMLLHLITPDDIYRKQEETFISWCDPQAGMTLSLSFQDTTACSNIWNTICQVQRKQRPGLRSASDTNAPQG